MNPDYLEPILREAINHLALDGDSMPKRLAKAFGVLHPVVTTPLTGRAETLRQAIVAEYSALWDGPLGRADYVLARMHHTRRRRIATNLLELYLAVVVGKS